MLTLNQLPAKYRRPPIELFVHKRSGNETLQGTFSETLIILHALYCIYPAARVHS